MNVSVASDMPLGPFAECDIFPLNGYQTVVQNLHFMKQNGLHDIQRASIQWRAVVHLSQNNTETIFSQRGFARVKALARARGLELLPSLALLVGGTTSRVEWNDRQPPSLVLYSDRADTRPREFLVESVSLDIPRESLALLRSQELLHWMKRNQDRRARNVDWFVYKYIEKHPYSPYGLQTHSAHIKRAIVALCDHDDTRDSIIGQGLLTEKAIHHLLGDYSQLHTMGSIPHEATSMPAEIRASTASPGPVDSPSKRRATSQETLDLLLRKLPRAYFDIPDIPADANDWSCPMEKCRWTTSVECYKPLPARDEDLIHFRKAVTDHFWAHLRADGLEELLTTRLV